MREIQASEAKTHFLRLLDEVEQGASLAITRHGRRVARIIPDEPRRQEEIEAAIKRIRERRKHAPKVSVEELIAWKNEGRL